MRARARKALELGKPPVTTVEPQPSGDDLVAVLDAPERRLGIMRRRWLLTIQGHAARLLAVRSVIQLPARTRGLRTLSTYHSEVQGRRKYARPDGSRTRSPGLARELSIASTLSSGRRGLSNVVEIAVVMPAVNEGLERGGRDRRCEHKRGRAPPESDGRVGDDERRERSGKRQHVGPGVRMDQREAERQKGKCCRPEDPAVAQLPGAGPGRAEKDPRRRRASRQPERTVVSKGHDDAG